MKGNKMHRLAGLGLAIGAGLLTATTGHASTATNNGITVSFDASGSCVNGQTQWTATATVTNDVGGTWSITEDPNGGATSNQMPVTTSPQTVISWTIAQEAPPWPTYYRVNGMPANWDGTNGASAYLSYSGGRCATPTPATPAPTPTPTPPPPPATTPPPTAAPAQPAATLAAAAPLAAPTAAPVAAPSAAPTPTDTPVPVTPMPTALPVAPARATVGTPPPSSTQNLLLLAGLLAIPVGVGSAAGAYLRKRPTQE